MELTQELENIKTHDSVFANGWRIGWVTAMAENRFPLEIWVPARHYKVFKSLLNKYPSDHHIVQHYTNQYSIEFIKIQATFETIETVV